MEKKKIICYSLEINDNDATEVDYISLVEDPAIQIDWLAFSKDGSFQGKEKQMEFKVQDASKRMITGVFLIPDKPIYRVSETGEEFAVVFSADDIERAVKKFHSKGYGKNIDTEHNVEKNGCYVVDSWFIRDENQNPLKPYGFKDIPVGSWVGTVHVPNEEYWNHYIKTGHLKGFSVMGMFKFGKKSEIEMEFSKQEKFTKEELELINKIADLLIDDENESESSIK